MTKNKKAKKRPTLREQVTHLKVDLRKMERLYERTLEASNQGAKISGERVRDLRAELDRAQRDLTRKTETIEIAAIDQHRSRGYEAGLEAALRIVARSFAQGQVVRGGQVTLGQNLEKEQC